MDIYCFSDNLVTFVLVLVLLHEARVTPMICSPEHPQRNYCQSAWVIKGAILSYTHNPSTMEVYPPIERLYEVQIHRLFKAYNVSDAIWYEGSIASISTDGDMNGTGVDMLQGETYIISGSTFEGQAIITKCNWYQLWNTLSPCHESALETGIFDKNCYCPVATCMGKMCYQQVQNPGCVNYEYTHTYDTCVYESTFNTCSWKKCEHVVDSGLNTPTNLQVSSSQQQGRVFASPHEQSGHNATPLQQQQQMTQLSQGGAQAAHSNLQQNLNSKFQNLQQQQQQQQRSWSTIGTRNSLGAPQSALEMRYAYLRNRNRQRRRRKGLSALMNVFS